MLTILAIATSTRQFNHELSCKCFFKISFLYILSSCSCKNNINPAFPHNITYFFEWTSLFSYTFDLNVLIFSIYEKSLKGILSMSECGAVQFIFSNKRGESLAWLDLGKGYGIPRCYL